jgi:hypothetical protein
MDKVLLLDTNVSSVPIYQYLISENYEVFVIGDNPDDYLAKISPNYHNVNYAKVEFVNDFIKQKNIKYLIPGCNDFSYKTCSELNRNNDFPGIESAEVNEVINNKELFRKFSIDNGVSVPRVFTVDNLPNNTSIIIKPIDSYSGNGVSVLRTNNKIDFYKAINKAESVTKSKGYLIEEFVEGQLYSHSAFIKNGLIYEDFIVEEHCIANPFAVDTSWMKYDFCEKQLNEIRKYVNIIVLKLNLKDGLLHTQFIKGENKLWFIEITRRCPGDLYSLLIEKSSGFRYAEEYCSHFLNKKSSNSQNTQFKKSIIRHTITSEKGQEFTSLEFKYSIHINQYFPISAIGSKLMPAPRGRIGLLFISVNNNDEGENIKNSLLTRMLYKIK